MKINSLIALGAFAAASAFAQDAAIPSVYDMCREALDASKSKIPANAVSAKMTAVEAEGVAAQLKAAVEDDPVSAKSMSLAASCSLYVQILHVESETQALRNHMAENWEKRAATARSIEAIQEQIGQARSGKVNDLEAEKAKMKDQEARLQAEMQQNQEKFQAEAAAKEAALKAANEREANLQKQQADLQKQQADLQKQLEAEKKEKE